MIINVTQENIDKGVRHDIALCPVALAAQDVFQIAVVVGYHTIVDDSNEAYDCLDYDNARKVEKFIRDFDNRKPVKPFSFEVKKQHAEWPAGGDLA
jgi:hypothetical protein